LLILTTGSQGEPMSGLTRMAFSEHRKLQIKPSDKGSFPPPPFPATKNSFPASSTSCTAAGRK
jgi:ribonuclease J